MYTMVQVGNIYCLCNCYIVKLYNTSGICAIPMKIYTTKMETMQYTNKYIFMQYKKELSLYNVNRNQ